MKPRHGGRMLSIAERYKKSPEDFIEFSASMNPIEMDLKEVILNSLDKIRYYPDNNYAMLKSAISSLHAVAKENICVGNGSVEMIRNFSHALLKRGDKILIPEPTFEEYEYNGRIFGAEPIFIGYGKFEELDKILPDIKIFFLCNPNNPTGRLIKKREMKRIMDICIENDCYLFVDEAFIELSSPSESLVKEASDEEKLFVLRSLTKCFSIPGLRVGYGIGDEAIVEKMEELRLPWDIGCIEEEVACYLLKEGESFLEISRDYIREEREWVGKRLSKLGLRPLKSDTNFLMVNVEPFSSKDLSEELIEKGIIVRDCSSFRSLKEGYMRIAIRKREDNIRLLDALKGILGG